MPIRDILNRSDRNRDGKTGEVIRFAIVGSAATLIQYGVYLMLISLTHAETANTAGYAVSFLFNFYASTHFTFRVKANARRGAGFMLSHAVNYLLQTGTLSFFIWAGVPQSLAPVPMFCVCVPVNFLLVRFFLKCRTPRFPNAPHMKPMFSIFRIRRDERPEAVLTLLCLTLLNALVIGRYAGKFMTMSDNYHRLFVRTFHVSGFDPLTYAVVSDWTTAYNIYRHPLLAFMMYVPYLANKGLMALTGVNLVQFVVASMLLFCGFYAYVFLCRIFREIVGIARRDAVLLGTLTYSFAFVMLSACVPDHFILSMFMLILTLYVSGKKMKSGRGLTVCQTLFLFFPTAGISLNNGIKVFLAALFTGGKRFLHPARLFMAVILPSALIWGTARLEWHVCEKPRYMARQAGKAKAERQRRHMIEQAFRDTTSLRDTALIRAGIARAIAHNAEERRAGENRKVWKKHTGKPIAHGEFSQWTDISTPRTASIIENLFGESIQLHADHLLKDTLTSRPVIVEYRTPLNYIVEGALVILFALGVWCGRRSRFLWLAVSFWGFDMLIHVVLGFGLNEVYIMGAHWLFVPPIAMAFLLKAAVHSRARTPLRLLILALTLFLLVWNGSLIVSYLT